TTGNGDRGVPGGTPGSSNYTGSPGNGTGGISHTLSGRDISPRQFSAEFTEGGRVVVRVKVDREGSIISKTVKSSPSRKLSDIALQKLAQAKFTRNPDAAPEQIGDITFVFKTRK
ncbi:MAG: TonB family protein, partial [Sphingobacteriales bacterium]